MVKGWRMWTGEGGRGRQEARDKRRKRNGSQLRFCMITAKTSFASGNGIQTCSGSVWLPTKKAPLVGGGRNYRLTGDVPQICI